MEASSSATATTTIVAEETSGGGGVPQSADPKSRSTARTLVLQVKKPERKVVWSEEVINNEHMNKKSSKSTFYCLSTCSLINYLLSQIHGLNRIISCVICIYPPGCCIFHKARAFGESDSEESDSDVEEAERAEPKPGAPKPYQRFHA